MYKIKGNNLALKDKKKARSRRLAVLLKVGRSEESGSFDVRAATRNRYQ